MSTMTEEQAKKILYADNYISSLTEDPQAGAIKLWEERDYYGRTEPIVPRVFITEGTYNRDQLLALLHFYPEEEK